MFFYSKLAILNRMNKLLTLPTTELTCSRGLTVILTTNKARTVITELIANLILLSPLFVIGGSEWLPAFELPRLVRRKTLDVKQILSRLYTARTSTCYRMLDSLSNTASVGEPILVLDFLHTFCDADIPYCVRSYKLRKCCDELNRLAFYRSVIVMTQVMQGEEYETFSQILCSSAKKTLYLEAEPEAISQPVLF
jgi:hypothetical protein